jgi:hypothetical protein
MVKRKMARPELEISFCNLGIRNVDTDERLMTL